jgi:ERCC4-type nuclease
MILVDPRSGSGELFGLFQPFDVQVFMASEDTPFSAFSMMDSEKPIVQLPFGDFCFWGNGPEGTTLIGIERKALSDFIQSMRTKRLSGHQLPGLLKLYGSVSIVLEGVWRVGNSGCIETRQWDRQRKKYEWSTLYLGNNPILFEEMDHHLATLQNKRHVVVAYTGDSKQTVAWIVSRYHWWNKKLWDQHRSDEAIYTDYTPINGAGKKVSFHFRTVPDVEKMVAQIGVDHMAMDLAKAFPTMEKLVQASVEDIAKVAVGQRGKKGARTVMFGEARAQKIYNRLRGIVV